jgi:hypothetical protein
VQSRQQRTSCSSVTRAVAVSPSEQGLPSILPLPQTRVLAAGPTGGVGGADGAGVVTGCPVGG